MTAWLEEQEAAGPEVWLERAICFVLDYLRTAQRPGACELVRAARAAIGPEAAGRLPDALSWLANDGTLRSLDRDYCHYLAQSGEVEAALSKTANELPDINSSIDALFNESKRYRSSAAFQELVTFMGRFKQYSPYNNLLVKLQNPSCTFYATAKDWQKRFGRPLKQDARPMLILAPMHPVLLVYDLDQTEGENLPEHLLRFAKFEGPFRPTQLRRCVDNAAKYKIDVSFRTLSSTHGGFAARALYHPDVKMRIVIHDRLDIPSRFGVLAHELAHILLGHLGSDGDLCWPARASLPRNTMEVEAEAVAYIVSQRFDLIAPSASYVSAYLVDGSIPPGVSVEMIARAAGLIERMATEADLPSPRPHKGWVIPRRRRTVYTSSA